MWTFQRSHKIPSQGLLYQSKYENRGVEMDDLYKCFLWQLSGTTDFFFHIEFSVSNYVKGESIETLLVPHYDVWGFF